MIEVVAAGNTGLMAGLLDKMGQGGAARIRLYAGTRPSAADPAPGALVALVYLAEPAGVIQANGDLLLTVGVESTLLQSTAPTWGRVFSGNEQHLFDCDARVSTAPDLQQEIVVAAPDGLYAGALLRIQSGTFSARP
jgi:hypothetical protein